MPKRSSHHGETITTAGSGLMTPAMALSASHRAAKTASAGASSRNRDSEVCRGLDGGKESVIETLGGKEEEDRRERAQWEDEMQAIAVSLSVSQFGTFDMQSS
jgi:hypothetical protein